MRSRYYVAIATSVATSAYFSASSPRNSYLANWYINVLLAGFRTFPGESVVVRALQIGYRQIWGSKHGTNISPLKADSSVLSGH
ncbi:hypothetical protein [Coleofasciculus sp. FACHB-129]|uniref:hypothetical protein n=1 Tax=Coleofasciculus sp. FACHB-129 TaxID=2692785 RepID=UPI001685BD7A|nr:hypothetical protein [Coleofasciculus sp. FACHB-129]